MQVIFWEAVHQQANDEDNDAALQHMFDHPVRWLTALRSRSKRQRYRHSYGEKKCRKNEVGRRPAIQACMKQRRIDGAVRAWVGDHATGVRWPARSLPDFPNDSCVHTLAAAVEAAIKTLACMNEADLAYG